MNEERRMAARAQLIEFATEAGGHRTSPRSAIVIAAVITMIASGTAAASWVMTRSVAKPAIVECRTSVSPDSSGVFVSSPEPLFPESDSGESAAVSLCATGWQTGMYVPGQYPVIPTHVDWQPPHRVSVPPLAVCVAPDGHAVVVPAETAGVCAGIGLARPGP